MARRVGTGANLSDDENVLTGLAFLQQLAGRGRSEALDFSGTSGDPQEFASDIGVPRFGDVRQNDNAYVDNLKKIAMLNQSQSTLPPGIQEEQLEGLSGAMGAQDAMDRTANINPLSIPTTQSGALLDPLEALRMRIEEEPSLLDGLPEETKAKLAQTAADRNRPFLSGAQQGQPPIPGSMDEEALAPTAPNPFNPNARPGDELIEPKLAEARSLENAQLPPVVPADQPITEDMVDNYPEKQLQSGAVERVSSDEQLLQDLTALGGVDIPPEQFRMAKQWQDIANKKEELLSAEEASLLQKAETGGLSTFEKIALGIAIAAPILIGLRYGKEAALSTLGNGLQTYGKLQSEQSKKGGNKVERLHEIQKERLVNQEKAIDINRKIIDSIPDKAARQFLRNKQMIKIGDRTGISTGDEGKALWLDASKFDSSDEGVKRARKVIDEADDTIGVMRDSNRVVNELLTLMDQLPQDTNMWSAIAKSIQGVNPLKDGPKIDIKGSDGKVRKVDALAQIKQKVNLLQDLYNKQILGGTRLTGNVVTHWGGILGDPTNVSDWFSQDLNTFKDTTRSLKDIMNSREVENLVGKGFLREPLEEQFPFGSDEVLQSESNLFDQMRQNPEAFQNKVK